MATKVIPKLVAMLKTDDCCTSAEVLCSLEGGRFLVVNLLLCCA